jgi:hypothetical protein
METQKSDNRIEQLELALQITAAINDSLTLPMPTLGDYTDSYTFLINRLTLIVKKIQENK